MSNRYRLSPSHHLCVPDPRLPQSQAHPDRIPRRLPRRGPGGRAPQDTADRYQVSHLVHSRLNELVRLLGSVCPIRSATAADAGLVRGTSDAPVCRPLATRATTVQLAGPARGGDPRVRRFAVPAPTCAHGRVATQQSELDTWRYRLYFPAHAAAPPRGSRPRTRGPRRTRFSCRRPCSRGPRWPGAAVEHATSPTPGRGSRYLEPEPLRASGR
jgi:hypothetical protein